MDAVLVPSPKAPAEDGVYSLRFADSIPEGDAISASAWTLPSGVAQVAAVFDAAEGTTTITVSGGTDGHDYLLLDTVTTVGGLTLDGFVNLRVRLPESAPSPVATVYAQPADMIARFGQRRMVELTDTGDVATGEVNLAVLAQALSDADATVNGYLQSRYTLPLVTIPQGVNLLACDIALYRLMSERPIEAVTQRYKAAIDFLDAVARGKLGLGLDSENNTVPEGDDGPSVHANRRVFTRHRLRDFTNPPIGGPGYDA
jgi:phage gp36-like protein